MTDDISIRPLGPSAGPALLALDRACPIEADFVFRFEREPDFFLWPRMIFDGFQYAGIYSGDELVGYCLVALRRAWAGQDWGPTFYAGDARVLPAFRGRRLTDRAIGWFAEHPPEADVGCFIVKEGNRSARKLVEGSHARGYTVRRLCRFEVLNVPLLGRRRRLPPVIRSAEPGDVAEIAALAQRAHRGRPLAPMVDEASLVRDWLAPEAGRTFALVAQRGGRIRGAALFRDLGPARRTVVLRYPPRAWGLRVAYGAAAALTGASGLPRAGTPLRALTTTLLAVDDDDPAIARALLSGGIALGVGRGYHLLHAGFAEGDPLRAAARLALAQRFGSELFLVARAGHTVDAPPALAPRIDLAML